MFRKEIVVRLSFRSLFSFRALVAVTLFIAGIISCALAFHWKLPTAQRSVASVGPTEPPHGFRPGTNQYYRLPDLDRQKMIAVVQLFCAQKYHAPSCVYYLSKCGPACLADISQADIRRVRSDYAKIRADLKLPPLTGVGG